MFETSVWVLNVSLNDRRRASPAAESGKARKAEKTRLREQQHRFCCQDRRQTGESKHKDVGHLKTRSIQLFVVLFLMQLKLNVH